jgi:uncharacterized membrane protein
MVLALLAFTLAIDWAASLGKLHFRDGFQSVDMRCPSLLESMMAAVSTVVALVFSVTLLVYSIAASQLGPRLVYRFLRDRTMQCTVGMFLGSFLFLLLTFVTLRREQDYQFVPQLSTVAGVLLVISSFATLVAYNHKVATSIQTNDAVAQIVDDLVKAIKVLEAERSENSPSLASSYAAPSSSVDRSQILARFETEGAKILASRSGYIERIARKELVLAALRSDFAVEILFRPGQFILEDEPVARVLPAEGADAFGRVVLASIAVGPNRTLEQDVEFAVAQLVEVALRALSSAVNDTFTALPCIDWMGEAVRMFAALPSTENILYGPTGEPRLIERPLPFPRVVKAAFDQIRQAGADNPAVIVRLLQT